MAEPKDLNEALEWYQTDKFSRKGLFAFVVAELKALRREHEDLKSRVADYMTSRVGPLHTFNDAPAPGVGSTTPGEVYRAGRIAAEAIPDDPKAVALKEAARQRMKEYWAKKKAEKPAEATTNG